MRLSILIIITCAIVINQAFASESVIDIHTLYIRVSVSVVSVPKESNKGQRNKERRRRLGEAASNGGATLKLQRIVYYNSAVAHRADGPPDRHFQPSY